MTESKLGIDGNGSPSGLRIKGHVLEPLLWFLDCVTILFVGVASTYAYHVLVLRSQVSSITINSYLAISFLAALLFILISKAANIYRDYFYSEQLKLLRLLNRTLILWIAVVVALSVLGFLLKTGQWFSRGTFLVFFLAGAVALIAGRFAWPSFIAFLATHEITSCRRVLLLSPEINSRERPAPHSRTIDSDYRVNGLFVSHQIEVNFDDLRQIDNIIPKIQELTKVKAKI